MDSNIKKTLTAALHASLASCAEEEWASAAHLHKCSPAFPCFAHRGALSGLQPKHAQAAKAHALLEGSPSPPELHTLQVH